MRTAATTARSPDRLSKILFSRDTDKAQIIFKRINPHGDWIRILYYYHKRYEYLVKKQKNKTKLHLAELLVPLSDKTL